MHNHSNEVFRCRKSMQSPKNRNLICKKNAVTYLSFKWSWPKLQVHNPPWWQRSIQSLRKIHWKIAEKNSRQKGTDGRTDGQTDRQTGWFQYTPPQLVGGGYKNVQGLNGLRCYVSTRIQITRLLSSRIHELYCVCYLQRRRRRVCRWGDQRCPPAVSSWCPHPQSSPAATSS